MSSDTSTTLPSKNQNVFVWDLGTMKCDLDVLATCVLVVHPLFAESLTEITENIRYGQACVKDAFQRGELPFSPALFYARMTEKGQAVRQQVEMAWGDCADVIAIYTDRGLSEDIDACIQRWVRMGNRIEFRTLQAYAHETSQLSLFP